MMQTENSHELLFIKHDLTQLHHTVGFYFVMQGVKGCAVQQQFILGETTAQMCLFVL